MRKSCTAATVWRGGENNNTAWRKKNHNRSRRRERTAYFRKTRAPERGIEHNTGPALTDQRHRHQSVICAPSEAIAMQHGGRCRRYRFSSRCCCCCCYCNNYYRFPNATTAADSIDIVVHDVCVHNRNVKMMSEHCRCRLGYTAVTATATALSWSSRQII